MGDRANCVVKQRPAQPEVYLYTHWSGHELLCDVQTALNKRWRWDDPNYLTRIIFDVMTAGQQGQETGYGIGTEPDDNNHDYVVVDVPEQQVRLEDPDSREVKRTWSFQDFINAQLDGIEY